ncbi:uncharacterized protein EV154DRAFT_475539 [Mucor mucedo]|uniref:uncharacterized protein n=1 Tax=Mucor mucedo TaxID=29922 RepID=UPI002220947B|nr:uncharacterized protein EV154DRAFT_475539 [Mucor mucedo]KAI7897217.1 hypothetical protein EV154DRAFT_475539 [Mucor mucedo]
MIGPAIPEALLKKKQSNESAIVISFSDDEEEVGPQMAGPQIPQHILEARSVGPQIPDHLLQQKRANTDEIAISDDEEEEEVGDIGPQIPQHLLNKTDDESTAGPQIPQHLLEKMSNVLENDIVGPQIPQHILETKPVEEDITPDDFAPALPPDLLEQRQKQTPQPQTGRRRRPVGPTFPTGPIPNQEEDEYMVGPALPKDYNPEVEAKYSAIHAIEERAREAREAMEKKEADKGKVQRPDWMLVPPEVDYLKKANSSKSRQFTNKTMSKEELDSAEWTMTPAQKQQRLEEERSGKRKMKDEETNFSELDIERIRNIQEYNMQTRPLTLLEIHQQKKKRSKEPTSDIEDVTKRAFDREKDLLGARKMDRKSKKEMLKQSAQFGQKFGYGSSSFL